MDIDQFKTRLTALEALAKRKESFGSTEFVRVAPGFYLVSIGGNIFEICREVWADGSEGYILKEAKFNGTYSDPIPTLKLVREAVEEMRERACQDTFNWSGEEE